MLGDDEDCIKDKKRHTDISENGIFMFECTSYPFILISTTFSDVRLLFFLEGRIEVMKNFQHKKVVIFFVIAILLRAFLYIFIYSRGYFYGKPWDSFSRTLLSYYWSNHPYFAPSDGYWLPLQFWINGIVFSLVKPWYPYSNLALPVLINNLFFIGSLLVTYKIIKCFTNDSQFSSLSLWTLSIFSADIFITFSGLCEPMLVFFILASGYYFYRLIITKRKKFYITAISIVSLLASATHYIGWFISLFFILFFSGWVINRCKLHKKVEVIELMPVFTSLVIPLIWLINAYVRFGSPLYPLQSAQHMQQPYLGQVDYWSRLLIIPKVLFLEIGIIAISGSIALYYLLLKKDSRVLVSIPGVFVLFILWTTTILGTSNPYQEPRYLVFYGWVIYPLVVLIAREYVDRQVAIIGISVLLTIYISQNFFQLLSYENSFDKNLEKVAQEIRPWCPRQSNDSPLIIIGNSFAESGVIPVLSGCPDKILFLTKSQFEPSVSDIIFERKCTLIVTKSKSIAEEALSKKINYKNVDRYFIFYCKDTLNIH